MSNLFNLDGKFAVVTGASSGLGRQFALALAREGANVAILARRVDRLEQVKAEVEALGVKCIAVKCDVADNESIKAAVAEVVADFGRIDILVNNAGITRDSMTRKMTDDQWDLVIDINLKGVFNLTRYVGPYMEEIGGGSIINISSVVGEYGNIGQANYAASKAGVIGLTKTWAKEFARKGVPVRCNAIAPGYIMTDMMKTVPEDLLKKFAGLTMLGRLGQPEEIAKAALFLASDDASYVTGHVLSVNGGMRL